MNIIFNLMLILPLIQTWLVWNGIEMANNLDDGLYILFILVFIVKIFMDFKNGKSIYINKQIKNSFYLMIIFFIISTAMTMIQMQFRYYLSIKGLIWELYKLSRNIFILIYSYLYVNEDRFKKVAKYYLIICTIITLITMFENILGLKAYEILHFKPSFEQYPDFYLNYMNENRHMGTFSHPNALGEFLSFGFVVLFYNEATNKNIFKSKIIQKVILLIIFTGILLSTSRMTFILTIVICVYLINRYKLKKGKQIIIYSSIVGMPFMLFAVNKVLYKFWQYYYYGKINDSPEMRIQAWKQSIMMFFDYILTGTGLGTWGDASASYSNFQYKNQLSGVTNILSDSYLSHLVAENGVYIFIFLLSIYFIYKFFTQNVRYSKTYSIICIHIILFISFASFKSMGISMFETSFFAFYVIGFGLKIVNYESRVERLKE